MTAFDVCGPLPTGTTLLEASAGTGKTFTIAALTARYVAEGVAELSQLMLVTFGNAASRELRDRVRERLVGAERACATRRPPALADDDVLRLLADVDDERGGARRARLARALAGFDDATIATTHSFCSQMLAGLGTAADADPAATFARGPRRPRPRGRRRPLPAHLRATRARRQPRITPRRAARARPQRGGQRPLRGARARRRRGRAGPAPGGGAGGPRRGRGAQAAPRPGRLRRLAGAAARRARRPRHRARGVRPGARALPRGARRRVPGHRPGAVGRPAPGVPRRTTLVLIGDPKQAIYAFRGGDVTTYLAASAGPTTRATLARNWRSDPPLLDALEHVLGGAALGDQRIVVRPVEAGCTGARLTGAGAPLRLRQVAARRPRAAGARLPQGRPVRATVAARRRRRRRRPAHRPARLHGRPVAPRRRRRAGAHQPAGRAGPRGARPGGRPGGARGRRQRVRHPERPLVAGAARGDGAAPPRGPGARGRAVGLPRRHARPRSTPTRDAVTDRLGPRLRGWADLLAERGRRRLPRGAQRAGAAAGAGAQPPRRRAAAHRPAPRRPVAARRGAAGAARPDRPRGVAAPPHRAGRRRGAPTSAPGGSSPTPPPCRS